MASVTSLDKDLRKMRLDRFTPAAASEARSWIEEALGEKLPSSDLLEGLKDGVALCKLVNLATPPPGVKFKKSAMPFVQMENISHFLRACQSPPLNLQQHDTFLTVDLYEQKDPAQVLQCLGAFSRAAHDANPGRFPEPIGPRTRLAGGISPQASGYASPTGLRDRGTSITSNASSAYASKPVLPRRTGDTTPTGRRSPTKSPTMTTNPGSPGPVSSWSKREHEGSTAPAWNIAQYGYMGGASQGNLGISFGGLRQITSASPHVPSLADKERRRKEEAERQEEEECQRRAQLEAEEEAARREEERRWEAEAQKLREAERRKVEEEKRMWEEQERQWKLIEEKRRQEEQEAEARLEGERTRARGRGDARLQGQFLSQYKAEQADADRRNNRSHKLEEQLERARRREAEYERERQTRSTSRPVGEIVPTKARSRSRHRDGSSPIPSTPSAVGPQRSQNRYESWTKDDERDYLQTQRSEGQKESRGSTLEPQREESADAEATHSPPVTSSRPLPEPNVTPKPKPPQPSASPLPNASSSRPLPDPKKYTVSPPSAPRQTRTDRFLATNTPPQHTEPPRTYSRELGATEERDGEDRRRAQSQNQTKAGGWASKSLLEREMEMERQRQQEWEEAQKETARAARSGDGVDGIGGRWDVGQWSGYTGGDSQNRGAQGIGSGRRQIVGPRPLPGSGR
ncbi:calponin [Metarhizium rileyi]|uniref:Calponin n=1 Tax=Metarhizium rileyi (strain RCEF 4871) TaxID=1649241 RepID=A0A166VTL7_METRR|nr:calponin [Metarhizium rileyi RCEF 4871]TWU76711.1 hypothetical protein ED733_002649 [Metarhizium rileyi]